MPNFYLGFVSQMAYFVFLFVC